MQALMRTTVQNHLVPGRKVQVVVMNPMMMMMRIIRVTLMKMKVHPVLMMMKTLNLKVRMKQKMMMEMRMKMKVKMKMKMRQTDPYPDLPKAKFQKSLNLKLILFKLKKITMKNAIPNSKPKVLLCHFSSDILPGLYHWVQL